jgi:hypothetical protein
LRDYYRLKAVALAGGVVAGLPPPPEHRTLPGGGPPPDFDFHTTGLAFDLLRPANNRERKVLEYALGYLSDRHALWWMDDKERGPRHYHVVPNPRFRNALGEIGLGGRRTLSAIAHS